MEPVRTMQCEAGGHGAGAIKPYRGEATVTPGTTVHKPPANNGPTLGVLSGYSRGTLEVVQALLTSFS